jgi:hypothetical protein
MKHSPLLVLGRVGLELLHVVRQLQAKRVGGQVLVGKAYDGELMRKQIRLGKIA